jgi:hypothetical protein
MRDNRDIFVYIEIRATRLPRSTNFFLSNVRLPTDSVLNRRRIHGCQEEVREEVRKESPRQEVVEEVRREEVRVQESLEEVVFEEGRQQEGFEESVIEEGFGLFEEGVVEESFGFEEGSRKKSGKESSCEESLVEEAQLLEEGWRDLQRSQRDQQSGQHGEGHGVRHRQRRDECDRQRRVGLVRFEQPVDVCLRSAARRCRAAFACL